LAKLSDRDRLRLVLDVTYNYAVLRHICDDTHPESERARPGECCVCDIRRLALPATKRKS